MFKSEKELTDFFGSERAIRLLRARGLSRENAVYYAGTIVREFQHIKKALVVCNIHEETDSIAMALLINPDRLKEYNRKLNVNIKLYNIPELRGVSLVFHSIWDESNKRKAKADLIYTVKKQLKPHGLFITRKRRKK
ncbi:MAG: hypothetical protein AABX02_05035 [archaeon]|mgnify:CR=1 FL=1